MSKTLPNRKRITTTRNKWTIFISVTLRHLKAWWTVSLCIFLRNLLSVQKSVTATSGQQDFDYRAASIRNLPDPSLYIISYTFMLKTKRSEKWFGALKAKSLPNRSQLNLSTHIIMPRLRTNSNCKYTSRGTTAFFAIACVAATRSQKGEYWAPAKQVERALWGKGDALHALSTCFVRAACLVPATQTIFAMPNTTYK